jgi:hypothetical protein
MRKYVLFACFEIV